MTGSIHVIDRDGSSHQLNADETMTLMEIMRAEGLSVEARCKGSAKCATCHVYVDQPWLAGLRPPTEVEITTLASRGVEPGSNSRLGCQIKWRADLDGIHVRVAPAKPRKGR